MIVHVRHPSGFNHALWQAPDEGPLVLVSWGENKPPTARPVSPEQVRHVVGSWREMYSRDALEVVTVDWPRLKTIAPIEEIEA